MAPGRPAFHVTLNAGRDLVLVRSLATDGEMMEITAPNYPLRWLIIEQSTSLEPGSWEEIYRKEPEEFPDQPVWLLRVRPDENSTFSRVRYETTDE